MPQLDENSTIITKEQDLHVFILDDSEFSLRIFKEIYGSRSRSNKEYWLIDVSYLENPEENLQNLIVDLDDDLFWYSYFGEITEINSSNSQDFDIKVWEVYR